MELLLLSCLILLLVCCVQQVISDGTISIHFNHFTNPQGLGANGHCCDGRAFFCLSPCDHYFIICLDHPEGNPHDFIHCPLGRFVTNKIDEMDSISFGTSIGGIQNPMKIPVRHWRDGFLLKIEVWDSDIGVTAGEYVDALWKKIRLPMTRKASLAESKTVLLSTRTSLTIEVKAYCNPNYYGPQCMTKCINQDDDKGHFSCDPNTGKRTCLPGWDGETCTNAINECASAPCQNGGTCVDDHNKYHCYCPLGTEGENCEINLDDCVENPCLNGATCHDGVGTYNCDCAYGFTGVLCQYQDVCASAPCQHNGTCITDYMYANYTCLCEPGYLGHNCEIVNDAVIITPNSMDIDKDHDILAIPILLSGDLTYNDITNIREWLVRAVKKSIAIGNDQFVAAVTKSPQCEGDDGSTVTNILLRVKYDMHVLEKEQIFKSKDFVTKKVDTGFPHKIYQGDDCMIAHTAAMVKDEKTWMSQNWFIPVGIGVVFVAIIIIVILVFLRRRRKNAFDNSVSYEIVDTSSSCATTPRHSECSAAEYDITSAFNNALYLQHNGGPHQTENGVVKIPELGPEEEEKLAECPYDEYEENFYHTID